MKKNSLLSSMLNKIQHVSIAMALLDAAIIAGSYFFALMIRFDFHYSWIDRYYTTGYASVIIWYILIDVIMLHMFHLYQSVWKFAGAYELLRSVYAWVFAQAGVFVVYLITDIQMPVSFYIIGGLLSFGFTTMVRFMYRALSVFKDYGVSDDAIVERVMVIGAGAAGREIIQEYMHSPFLKAKVFCVVDDDARLVKKYINGVPIEGTREDIPDLANKYDINKIILAIPSAPKRVQKEILDICSSTSCRVQTIPGVYQLLNGTVSIKNLRDVDVEDLLGRDTVETDLSKIGNFIKGKVVMVTGGGGSIGSELCRQVAEKQPKALIIFDIFEGNAYWIQLELKKKYGNSLNLITLIGSVRNMSRLDSIMGEYKPDIIFHAAAHKHVPLMEDSPNEAIKNNVMGTYNVADAAIRHNVKWFVLISTDKAVNPTNIMGASKRLCEMIIQMMNRRSRRLAQEKGSTEYTKFSAVRFGNVLGSSGSVIPLFKKQIEAGGPVTVTDKNIIRYFMTIPEAVALVLQAAYYAQEYDGDVFVLDMGDPVKIDDMARKLIRLSGYIPDVDIEVKYTGLRPGEKLYEERLMDEEGMQTTENKMISIGHPISMDDDEFMIQLEELEKAANSESPNIKQIVSDIVPTYVPKD